MAVTFDDLPAVGKSLTIAQQKQLTRSLLRSIRAAHVPAIGFVNENKMSAPEHTAMLRQWLASGLELGNHTYSHPDLHRIDVAQFEAEIVSGEKITRELLRQNGRTLRWFRHPFLHTGTSLETRDRVNRFLAERDYRVAPVTLDNADWIFARAYELANDRSSKRRVGVAYIAYMEQKVAYFEEQSRKLFGRNIRQVLLLHANLLNADWFDDLAEMLEKRGYRFVTLERAVEDEAYRSPDTFVGKNGISWLHRWAYTAGKHGDFFAGETKVPQWISNLSGLRE